MRSNLPTPSLSFSLRWLELRFCQVSEGYPEKRHFFKLPPIVEKYCI